GDGRAEGLVAVAATAAPAAGCLIAARVATFALRRREPVEPTASGAVRLLPPFAGLEPVFDFVYRMQCPTSQIQGLPPPLLGEPDTPPLRRFHDAYVEAWGREVPAARAELERFLAGDKAACAGATGHWRFERKAGLCRMTFKDGWPSYTLAYALDGKAACTVDVPDDILRSF